MTVLEKLSLIGRVAIVTGGGTGLGKGICHVFAQAGADIVAAGRRLNLIEETADEVRQTGRRALAVRTDITDSGQCNELVARALAALGRVDILVNCAGISAQSDGDGPWGTATILRGQAERPIWEVGDEELAAELNTEVKGTFYCCRAVAKHMVERASGNIITLSSPAAVRGVRGHYTYAPAKAAVIEMTQVLAATFGRYGIRVNCIVPYATDASAAAGRDEAPNLREKRIRRIPLGRVGHAKDVANLAHFLVSDASGYITGQLIAIDGGILAPGFAPSNYLPAIPLAKVEGD